MAFTLSLAGSLMQCNSGAPVTDPPYIAFVWVFTLTKK